MVVRANCTGYLHVFVGWCVCVCVFVCVCVCVCVMVQEQVVNRTCMHTNIHMRICTHTFLQRLVFELVTLRSSLTVIPSVAK